MMVVTADKKSRIPRHPTDRRRSPFCANITSILDGAVEASHSSGQILSSSLLVN